MFSVVIPLFEKRGYIQRALDSVYAQTIEVAAVPEILVVNDGSTDGGDAIAKAQADPRVRVIDQPNRGVSAARNSGIEAASQPFIAFLDADDRWRAGFLAAMRGLIAAWPGAALYGSGFVTMRHGREVSRHGAAADEIEAGSQGGPVDSFAVRRRDHAFNSSSIVVPKGAALAVGGFPEGSSHGEDLMLWDRLALHGSVVLTPEPLAEYDASVPGQATEYWEGDYKERFDVLAYHRFLADEVRRRANSGVHADASFMAHARRQLRTAVLQRFYWGNFAAVDRLWRELLLDGLGLGAAAGTAAWMARQRGVQPVAGVALAAARALRSAARRAGALMEPCR